ncbi:MAG TPA: response regulator transcription factor [Thermodesulfobacteriota bacterium]|nr:response regulator transcription factor [Thermodesulfobacteriota bacterium]
MVVASYHIVLADDHVMFRQGLKRILAERSDLEVIGEVGCGLELLKLLEKLVPDLIILDISMPNLRGLEAIHDIKMNHPKVRILVLTMHKDKEYLRLAITGGAEGYLLKEDADSELFSAIDMVRRGKKYISPELSEGLAKDWIKVTRGDQKPSFEPERLTVREREVLKLIAEGKSSKEIGDVLFISARTVEHHRANIMDKLNLKKTADLVKYAIQKGYV